MCFGPLHTRWPYSIHPQDFFGYSLSYPRVFVEKTQLDRFQKMLSMVGEQPAGPIHRLMVQLFEVSVERYYEAQLETVFDLGKSDLEGRRSQPGRPNMAIEVEDLLGILAAQFARNRRIASSTRRADIQQQWFS